MKLLSTRTANFSKYYSLKFATCCLHIIQTFLCSLMALLIHPIKKICPLHGNHRSRSPIHWASFLAFLSITPIFPHFSFLHYLASSNKLNPQLNPASLSFCSSKMSSKCPKRPLTPLMDTSAFREVHPNLPPIHQHRLYPDVGNTVPPGGIAPIEQPFSSIVPPNCQQRQYAAPNPPPYCEYHSAGYGAGIADGCGCQNAAHQEHNRPPPIGVRYFVHGPPQQIGGGEFHQIQQQHGPAMAPIQNGVFYYVSPSTNYVPVAEPSFMFFRRRPISYASFAVFCILAAVFLLIFIKMHSDMTRKIPPQTQILTPPIVNHYGDGGIGGIQTKRGEIVMMPITMKPPNSTIATYKPINGTIFTTMTTNKPANTTKAPATTVKPSNGTNLTQMTVKSINQTVTLAPTTAKPPSNVTNAATTNAPTTIIPKNVTATNLPIPMILHPARLI